MIYACVYPYTMHPNYKGRPEDGLSFLIATATSKPHNQAWVVKDKFRSSAGAANLLSH